jgi:glycosyltransferase involved in cell wall biosynthesis
MSNCSVVHVIPCPDGGGAELLVRELVNRLPSYGVESRAIYFWNPRGGDLGSGGIDLKGRGPRDWRTVFRLRKVLKQHLVGDKPLIVHSHLTWPLYFLPAALSGMAVPMFYTEHSTNNKRRDYRWLQPLERLVYRRYKKIICISQGAELSLDAWLGGGSLCDRTEVVPNGARQFPFFVRSTPRERRGVNLVSVGSLVPHKGFDVAIRAVASLGDVVERYTIVGEGPERTNLESLSHDLGVSDKVSLSGYVDDVKPYLYDADLALVPSRWEGFSLVAIEALSTGLPVVASDVVGMREVLSGCPSICLAKPEDPKALANVISYALNNLVGDKKVAREAREHANKYGIELMVESYANLYKQMWNDQERSQRRHIGRC